MSLQLRIWAIFVVTVKRICSQPWLALAAVLGLIVAVALTLSIPLYADAVYYRVLLEELSERQFGGATRRPPFAFMFQYSGSWAGATEWEDVQPADEYLSGLAGRTLGLPLRVGVRYYETSAFSVFSQDDK